MKYYSKNIFRNVLQNRGSYIGAVIIISIGIAVFIGMTEFLNNLEATLEHYCEQNSFADVFAYHPQGAGLKYSYNTRVGPISLTGHWMRAYGENHFGAYFSFGYTF